MHQIALAAARQAGDRPGQARALLLLGAMQVLTGGYAAAVAPCSRRWRSTTTWATGPARQKPSPPGLLHGRTGDYPSAAACHQQALELSRDPGDRPGQAYALNDLGIVHGLTGDYPAATAATSRRWNYSATSVTSTARSMLSSTWAPCSG